MYVDVTRERSVWSNALTALGEHDFTHTFDFHHISLSRGEGEPLAYILRDDDGRALAMWPVLKREIGNTGLFDFTSVYGYAGPLLRSTIDSGQAIGTIFDAMRENGAVSLFSRMHPLFVNQLDEGSRGRKLGDVVVIEVGENEDVLRGYRGGHRREITNAQKKGVSVSIETGPSAVAEFHDIYQQAMADLDADRYYFFDEEYLKSLEGSSDFKTLLFFAEVDGKKIAASIFVVTGSLMQYYLSGTRAEYRRLSPSKAIIAEAHKLAVKIGLRHLVLGGGVGSGKDALFEFKRGFSPLCLPFYVTRQVLDDRRYSALCAQRNIVPDDVQFFPAYRSKPMED